MIKGQMALEYVMKLTILLVVVAVVIGIIIKFSDDIKLSFKKFFCIFSPDSCRNNLKFPQIIEKSSFTSGEISTYIESCYSSMASLPESEQEDTTCYLLKANRDFSSISQSDISLSRDLQGLDKVVFKPLWNNGIVITIKYEDVGNRILVSG
ncbi:MAG: hypothetical protein AUJ50_02610 [Candidatus Aenigmarchaeota archaeon CG1_02_38_14]|nr:MAG: hypothetical protein AUJ50_02610 [Candidatus Aenigmarchaeota archaeon CG1_02_38_14]PIV68384.1 MAG: hypothetical protein COS07_04205 [Candidatus Aenigmarchaeota archaeon CG01_land_8_20_14_3_00_37_9]